MIETEVKTSVLPALLHPFWQEWEFSNLLEILRLYAEKYCRLVGHAQSAGLEGTLSGGHPEYSEMALGMIETLLPLLQEMKVESERIGLEATSDAISNLLLRWEQYHDLAIYLTPPGTIGCGFTSFANGTGSI